MVEMRKPETVTTGLSASDYIRWCGYVKKGWKHPKKIFLQEVTGTQPQEIDDEENEPRRFKIAKEWIEAAQRIADSALWREDLPRFNPRTHIRVEPTSLQEVEKWADRRDESERAFSPIRRICKERFGQYAVLQEIRRFLENLAVEAPPKDSYQRRIRLRIPVFFSLKVDPRKSTTAAPQFPPIYQQFLDALAGIDVSRIRRCPECNKLFWAARYQHTTCSAKCRKNRSRSLEPSPNASADSSTESSEYRIIRRRPKRRFPSPRPMKQLQEIEVESPADSSTEKNAPHRRRKGNRT
jgi:hypothetical protein